ncbi:MAG: HAD-IIA family hydrolase [Paenisporosarcina sp.]|nr:HAD-IIA family hydrolase [Paenisporosarcina sp.]
MAGYIFDLDGTIYLGDKLINGALETYDYLISNGHKVVFVTNKPIASQEDYHRKLTKFGLDVKVNQIVNSSYATAIYLTKYATATDQVYVVGEQPLIEELNQAKIPMTNNPLDADYVVVSWDRQFTYDKLNNMYQAWKNGAKFVATNPDRTCPVDGGEVPDCGSIMGAFTAATGNEITEIGGKPSRLMADLVLEEVVLPPARDPVGGQPSLTDEAADHLDVERQDRRNVGGFEDFLVGMVLGERLLAAGRHEHSSRRAAASVNARYR